MGQKKLRHFTIISTEKRRKRYILKKKNLPVHNLSNKKQTKKTIFFFLSFISMQKTSVLHHKKKLQWPGREREKISTEHQTALFSTRTTFSSLRLPFFFLYSCKRNAWAQGKVHHWSTRGQINGVIVGVVGQATAAWYGAVDGVAMVGRKVLVDKREAHKLFLVDALNDGRLDGRQHWVFFGKLGIKVLGCPLPFLSTRKNRSF